MTVPTGLGAGAQPAGPPWVRTPSACYAEAMKRLLLAAVLLLLLVPAAWLLAEWRFEAAVQDWAAARRAEGWAVRSGPAAWAGFPFRAALVLPDVALSSPGPAAAARGARPPVAPAAAGPAPGGLDWAVPRLELGLSPLHPLTLALRPLGAQRLRLAPLPPLAVEAEDARIAVPLRPAPGSPAADPAIVATATALRLAALDGGTASAASLSLLLVLHPGAPRDAAAATVQLDATDVALPALPAALRTLSLAGAVEGPLAARPTPAATAAAWRDGGGRVVLQRFAAQWGDLAATGSATLTLDGALQPAATATVRLAGYDAALDALAASGTIGPGTARVARAVLGLMAQPDAGGAHGVELPVTWRSGVVSAGQIPLLRTPPVAWSLGAE